MESSWIRDRTCVSCIDRGILCPWASSGTPTFMFIGHFLSFFWSGYLLFSHSVVSDSLWPHRLLLLFEVTTCCSVTQSCLTLGDPMDCSMPGFPVLHHLSEVAQIHVHRVGDAIQLSHPLSSPSSALHPSQHQGLFQWVGFLHQGARVLATFFYWVVCYSYDLSESYLYHWY